MLKSYKSILSTLVIGAAVTGYALSAQAATNPVAAGATSTGDFEVQVEIAGQVLVSALNDLDLGSSTIDASGNAVEIVDTENFCVYSNTNAGAYDVTVSSTGAADFEMTDGTDIITYTAKYNTNPLTEATKLADQAGHNTALDCGAADNTALEITVPGSEMEAVGPGIYTDTLTIVIEPKA
ncbi:MAG: hypothetical protein ACTSXQ_01200 [Alphaproteobacteria bacterium]